MRRLQALRLWIVVTTCPNVAWAYDGCAVILCLSNPAGWATVAQCVPPVQAAWKDMLKGRFPTCSYSTGTSDQAQARMTYVQDGTTTNGDGDEVPVMVRVMEFRDASGKIQRVRF
jgi:hypothetical protein